MAINPASLVLGPIWLIWRAPDGRGFEGTGWTTESAVKHARRRWRALPLPLTADGREHNRRRKARMRRRST
jgi:hypothetical protein